MVKIAVAFSTLLASFYLATFAQSLLIHFSPFIE
jgi:hypothetical protein